MKRYFITHIAPKDKILEYNLSSAACNFSYTLIECGAFDKVYSVLPSNVRGHKLFPCEGMVEYIYSTWRWKNRLFNKLAPIRENLFLFKLIDNDSSVWLYNMTFLNVFLVLLLRWFKKSVKVNVIVLDFTPGEKYNKVFLNLINKCNGRILLANFSSFNKTNSIVLPGVTPSMDINHPRVTEFKKEFLVSGVLEDNIAMLSMLLEAFSKMPNFTLHITGMITDDTKIKEFSNKYKNIKYHGCVSYNKYLDILHSTPFLLSTRNPDYPENKCNFPSKIIEALLHNRIIISTLHYDQLDGISYFEIPSQIDAFIKTIESIVGMSDNELINYANQSHLVQKMFNTNVWKAKISEIENNVE